MENIKVLVGTVESGRGGISQDNTRLVEFEGEELGSTSEFGYEGDRLTNSRGVKETLYRARDGRLLVHICDWSHWQGEPTRFSLREISEDDLGPRGEFAFLGAEAGFGRPLTLDEALPPPDLSFDC